MVNFFHLRVYGVEIWKITQKRKINNNTGEKFAKFYLQLRELNRVTRIEAD